MRKLGSAKLPAFNAARPIVEYSQHAPGRPHTSDTIRKMAALATQDQASYEIRRLATTITHDVPSKDVNGELFALYCWVRDNVRYRFDPVGVEWLQRPQRTVAERAGDCDDMATLLAALCGALGHRWRFYTVGPSPNVDEHIAVQVFNGQQWVTLDPVLEPMQASTAPRTDVGAFGRTAPGHSHVWNSEGRMLNGPTTLAQRQLWQWTPCFPQVAPTGNSIKPFFALDPDTRYRAANAPGFQNGTPITLAFQAGEQAPPMHLADGMGRIPYTHRSQPGYLLPLTNELGAAASISPADLAIARAFMAHNKLRNTKTGKIIAPTDDFIAQWWNAIGASRRDVIRRFRFDGRDASALLPALKSVISKLPVVGDVIVKVQEAVTKPGGAPLTAIVSAAANQVHPELARKYSKQAKQVFKDGLFYIYQPSSSLRGGPTITFSLGAAQSGTVRIMPTAQQHQLAADMVSALQAYEQKHGKPFYGKGVHVTPFQAELARAFKDTSSALKADGEYGPNAQAAGAWALGVPVSSMPKVASQYARYPLTWREPTKQAKAKPASKPATKPAAAKPATPPPATKPAAAPRTPSSPSLLSQMQKTVAQAGKAALSKAPAIPGMTAVGVESNNPGLAPVTSAAPKASTSGERIGIMPTAQQHQLAADMVSALQAYEQKHGKPFYGKGVHVTPFQAELARAFKDTSSALKADGEYGPNAQAAGAWALGVPVSSMPKVASQYARYPLTWREPTKAGATVPSGGGGKKPSGGGGKKPSGGGGKKPSGGGGKKPSGGGGKKPSGGGGGKKPSGGGGGKKPSGGGGKPDVTKDVTSADDFSKIPDGTVTVVQKKEETNWVPWAVAYYFYQRSSRRRAA